MRKKVHQKLDTDVVESLHRYRVIRLGSKATMSDAIRDLLRRCQDV